MLEIIEKRGFQQDFVNYFKFERDASPAGGRVKELWRWFIIEGVKTDSRLASRQQAVAFAGFGAVQSMPLIRRILELLGVLSTHLHKDSSRRLG